jgi:hypothetical protein
MSWTSKWRILAARREASRQAAKASGRIASSDSPFFRRSRNFATAWERAVGQRHHLGFERIDLLAHELPVAPDGALVLGAEDLAQELADPFDQDFHVHNQIPAKTLRDGKGNAPAGTELWNVEEDRRAPVVGDDRLDRGGRDRGEVGIVVRDVDRRWARPPLEDVEALPGSASVISRTIWARSCGALSSVPTWMDPATRRSERDGT